MGKGWKSGKGNDKVPCPTTSMAERALLESYRMGQAWGNTATSKDSGNGSGKGSTGKGTGKSDSHAKGRGKDKQCRYENCRAARSSHATWGGAANCHCCRKPLGQQPPLEQMAEWTYVETLADTKGKKAEADRKVAAPKTRAANAKAAPASTEACSC